VLLNLDISTHFGILESNSGLVEWLKIMQGSARQATDDFHNRGFSGTPEAFISEKLDFLIGMLISRLNLVDNRVGKILSVVALVFLPPTLIGSIYGMNFRFMPELAVPWAYPLALVAMLASAVIPYLVFKWRRWL